MRDIPLLLTVPVQISPFLLPLSHVKEIEIVNGYRFKAWMISVEHRFVTEKYKVSNY